MIEWLVWYFHGSEPTSRPDEEATPDPAASTRAAFRQGLEQAPLSDLFRMYDAYAMAESEIRLAEGASVEARSFLAQPDSFADIEHWGRVDVWTLEEAVALSLGRNPHWVNADNLQQANLSQTPLGAEFFRRLDAARRGQEAGYLQPKVSPNDYVEWAHNKGFDFPQDLLDVVWAYGCTIHDWRSMYLEAVEIANANEVEYGQLAADYERVMQELLELRAEASTAQATPRMDRALNPKERRVLYTILITVAVKKYRYNRHDKKSPTVSNILSDVHEIGLPLGRDALRSHLVAASELLDEVEKRQAQNPISD